MKVFITGGTGKLGQAVVSSLIVAGHQPSILSRNASFPLAVHGNLLEPESYAHALQGAQALIHLAALTHSANPDAYYTINARGTDLLLEACRAAGVRRFIHVSTQAVGKACGAYGESKAMAEDSVRQSGLDWTILRPAEVYMEVGREAIGRMIGSVRQGPMALYVADARALLAPVHRDDVVAAITAALCANQSIGKTYSLAGPEEFTQASFLRRLARLFAVRRVFVPVPLAVLRCASAFFTLLGLKSPPFVPDQIPRMLCAKERCLDDAWRDLGFAPRDISQGMAHWAPPTQRK